MKISELFRQLSYGALSNLAINKGNGVLAAEKYPQIIQYVNDGLLQIFTRFVLRERNLILEQTSHVLNYHLRRQYATSSESGDVRHRYIIDCAEDKFADDVIKVLSVQDELGCFLPLNDAENPASLFTPRPLVLQVPAPKDGVKLAVLYQARHPILHDTADTVMDQEVDIPFSLENALKNFVGYKVYSDMNGQENIVKGQEYLAAYEAICLEVEQRDLVNQTFHTSHTKLEQRGFV